MSDPRRNDPPATPVLSLETARVLPYPPDAVFAALADPERYPEWLPGTTQIDRKDAGALVAGSAWDETRVLLGYRATEEVTVREVGSAARGTAIGSGPAGPPTEATPDSILVLDVDCGPGTTRPGRYLQTVSVEPVEGGCRVRIALESLDAFGPRGSALARFLVEPFQRRFEDDLDALGVYLSRR